MTLLHCYTCGWLGCMRDAILKIIVFFIKWRIGNPEQVMFWFHKPLSYLFWFIMKTYSYRVLNFCISNWWISCIHDNFIGTVFIWYQHIFNKIFWLKKLSVIAVFCAVIRHQLLIHLLILVIKLPFVYFFMFPKLVISLRPFLCIKDQFGKIPWKVKIGNINRLDY
jgi:hypothetical protein